MKIFKIALNSDDTNAWFGSSKMDALYSIDLKKVLPDPTDYDKEYEVSFTFKSMSATSASSGLTMTSLYALCLEFGKGYTTFENRFNRNYVGLLTLNNDFTAYTSTACNIYFDTKESDNAPIYLSNVKDLYNIRLSVITTNNNSVIADATNLRYSCILTFKQL